MLRNAGPRPLARSGPTRVQPVRHRHRSLGTRSAAGPFLSPEPAAAPYLSIRLPASSRAVVASERLPGHEKKTEYGEDR